MQMISMVFFLLTALVLLLLLAGNRILKEEKARVCFSKWVLLLAGFLFAAYGDLRFALVLGLLCLVTWAAARSPKFWGLGVVFALLSLGYFKYTGFFLTSIGRLLGREVRIARILLPLGISFYTFSAISYMADVHRGKLRARSLLDVSLYLSFFPKLTSGPIQRSEDFFRQTDRPRQVGWASVSAGIQIFMFGLFKKLVLADRLSVFVDQVYYTPRAFDSLTVLLAVIAYSFQLYLDFSGYSDMAIGAARMLDVELPRNFNLPYLSRNITEFWKRWHMTLSSWLQDYLYIPLGGSRRGKLRSYGNLILTMVLGGLWHGASINYVLWGLINGLGLVVHKLWSAKAGEKPETLLRSILSTLGTFTFVSFTWIFFRAETPEAALTVLSQLLSFRGGVRQLYVWLFAVLILYFISVLAAARRSAGKEDSRKKKNTCRIQGYYPEVSLDSFWGLTLFFVFCGLILGLAYTGGSPFIYGGY